MHNNVRGRANRRTWRCACGIVLDCGAPCPPQASARAAHYRVIRRAPRQSQWDEPRPPVRRLPLPRSQQNDCAAMPVAATDGPRFLGRRTRASARSARTPCARRQRLVLRPAPAQKGQREHGCQSWFSSGDSACMKRAPCTVQRREGVSVCVWGGGACLALSSDFRERLFICARWATKSRGSQSHTGDHVSDVYAVCASLLPWHGFTR